MFKFKQKDSEFFDLFVESAQYFYQGALMMDEVMLDYSKAADKVKEVVDLEHAADAVNDKIIAKLNLTFITPLDREDISDLALAMDNVTDAMYGVTMRLDLFNLSDMRLEAEQIADLTVRAVKEMQEMINRLPEYNKKPEPVMEKAISLGDIEDEGDTVYQNALRRLFREEDAAADGKYAVTWLRIFDRMEQVLDACDDAAGIVRAVIMKSA